MKNLILYYIIILAHLLIVGCEKDTLNSDPGLVPQEHFLNVFLAPNNNDTNFEFTNGESAISFEWEDGDCFTIYDMSGAYVATYGYVSSNGNDSAIFSAVGDVNALSVGSDYTAIYPAIDNVKNLAEHRTELSNMIITQTQVGTNDSHHIKDVLRMESSFSYAADSQNETYITFEHTMAIMSISFALYDEAIPVKLVSHIATDDSYTINIEDAKNANNYTINYVINPVEKDDIDIYCIITLDSGDDLIFSTNSNVLYSAGNCYIATLSDIITIADGYTPIFIAQEMYNIRNNLSGNFILMNDIDLSGYSNWIPVGAGSTSFFSGAFNGGGHSISGLTIDRSNSYQGLFGYIKGGTISNLLLKEPNIKGGESTGAICGYIESSKMIACGIAGGLISGESTVGGVAGGISSSSITACYNTGTVAGVSSSIGGVVGSVNSSSISACYNTGTITGIGSSIGGVVGAANSYSSSTSITECYCISGEIYTYSTTLSTLNELNSVVTSMNKAATKDYFTVNSGNIIPSLFDEQIIYEDFNEYIEDMSIFSVDDLKKFRDLVNSKWAPKTTTLMKDLDLNGEEWTPINNYSGSFDGNGHSISGLIINSENSYQGLFASINGGSVTNLILKNPQIHGNSYVGAVCGYITSGQVTNCGVAGGDVYGLSSNVGGVVGYAYYYSTITSCYNTGCVTGNSSVGGVVGNVYSSSFISECYNTGTISGVSYVGGIMGYADAWPSSINIMSCYNTGAVSGSFNYVGGIVGKAFYCYYIISCYNTGGILASGNYVGGIVGQATDSSSATITACYFIDNAGDDANRGVGSSTSSNYTYMVLSSTSELNAKITTMNLAAGGTYYEQDAGNYNGGYPILSSIDYKLE